MTVVKIVSLALLAFVCINHSYALICDSYQNYSFHATSKNTPDTLLKGCSVCGYFQSNITTPGMFKGVYVGCLSNVAQLVSTTQETLFNVTQFVEQCTLFADSGITYCDDSEYPDGSGWDQTSICCCSSDYCSRGWMSPSIPLVPTAPSTFASQ
uniref:Secreted protein n=1 Tax=Rhabditophanes sp. KR3021 TaxID=114890 RepID=A0AC35UH03_9BILA